MGKRKMPIPSYWRKNVAQNAQRKFLQRKRMEADQEKRKGTRGEKTVEEPER